MACAVAVHHRFDRRHDVGIRAAAADIAAHELANIITRARPARGDQTGSRTDLPWGAITALEGVVLDEGLLQGMQRVPLRETFDRRDPRAVLHDRKRQAGVDRPAVDQNRTGAALAVVAALLGPGEIEIETQRI